MNRRPSSSYAEWLEPRTLLTAVPFGPQQIIDELDNTDPSSVLAADLDGDGDQDLLVTSYGDDQVTWYENRSAGGPDRFVRHPIDDSALEARDAVAVDFDGDGDLDIAVAAYEADQVQWYPNTDGKGTFGSARLISTGMNGVRTLATGDLNGDGTIDLVSGSWIDNKVAWYANDGNGGFSTPRLISFPTEGPRSVKVGDINLDGHLDIIVASRRDDTVSWFANDGLGNFGVQNKLPTVNDGPQSIELADVDQDGDLDVFMASWFDNTIAWFKNTDGKGTFGPQQNVSTTAERGVDVALADLDGDGDLDLVSGSSYLTSNKVVWYRNLDGQGTFSGEQFVTNSEIGIEALALVDIDQNGATDVVIASRDDDKIVWYPNSGGGQFGLRQQVNSDASGAGSVELADLDGDGDLDALVSASADDEVSWYPNLDGAGNFGPSRVISIQARNVQVARAVDLDGDGDLDVLSASLDDDKIAWYKNLDGRGNFGPQQIITNRVNGAVYVHAADLDGDGDLDVASASTYDGIIAWYPNTDGQGTFGAIQILTRRAPGAEWVTSADLDGDGDEDLLAASYDDGRVIWFENLNNSSFMAAETLATVVHPTAVEAVDIDHDGDLDLAIADYVSLGDFASQLLWVEQTDGPERFSEPRVVAINFTRLEALSIADVDGNGHDDIIAGSEQGVYWFERTGNEFQAYQVTNQVSGVFGVAADDINGDGQTDLASASVYDSKVAWYPNQSATGDFDGDANVDAADIDLLCRAVRENSVDAAFDLNRDGQVGLDDHQWLIKQILRTSIGDANLDGRFNSQDFVRVFLAGQYEDGVPGNSGWAEGDWDCNGDFDSSDFVAAFLDGGYTSEAGPAASFEFSIEELAASLLADDQDRLQRPRPSRLAGTRHGNAQRP